MLLIQGSFVQVKKNNSLTNQGQFAARFTTGQMNAIDYKYTSMVACNIVRRSEKAHVTLVTMTSEYYVKVQLTSVCFS